MKIAFVLAKAEFSIPLGIAYLSSILKRNGCDVEVFEAGGQFSTALNRIKSFNPDIVAYSVISGSQNFYLRFNKELRSRIKTVSLFGGPHATFFPEIIEDESVDAVCIGEGELALEEFVKKFTHFKELPENIYNFWVKKGDRIFKNHVCSRLNDLDILPFPDRKLFYDNFSIINQHRIKHFMAHRGCPYGCTYCFNKPYNEIYKEDGLVYRSRRPDKVCEEIEHERAMTRLDMVAFIDDVFTLDKKWVKDFSGIYKKEIGLPFSVNARFDNLDEEIVSFLKDANCALVYVGVESGNDFMRNKILKRNMSLETIVKSAKILNKYHIKFLTENFIGIPGESMDAVIETLKVNMRIRPDYSNCSFFTPYPKLELTDFAVKNGYFDENFSKLNINYYHKMIIKCETEAERNKKSNLRCFFSFLVRHPRFFVFFNSMLLPLSTNGFFRKIGDIIDGYYLKKCLPYKMSITEIIRNVLYYVFRYRRETD